VLRRVYDEAPISRAMLASRIGLNKSTVSSLVEDLLERKLVREMGTDSNGAGRPATLLEINPRVGAVISIEMGVDFVAAALIDFMGVVLWRKQIEADGAESQQRTMEQIHALVDESRVMCEERQLPVLGLSFALPGTVDLHEGTLIFAPNLNWHNVPFRRLFEVPGMRVYVENDANAAAVGEHLFGAAQHARDFIFVFAGVGLGGGLFLDGELHRGKGGYAGEIGHMRIPAEPYDLQCHCGKRGCWELYASQESILRRVREASGQTTKDGQAWSLKLIKQTADGGDTNAARALAEAGTSLGIGIAALVNVLDPEKVIIGGPVSMAGDHLLPAVIESVRQHGVREIVAQVEISLSAFGPDASVIGAAAVVVNDILMNPSQTAKEVMAGIVVSRKVVSP
jgi:glucokinase-like ROK family protein